MSTFRYETLEEVNQRLVGNGNAYPARLGVRWGQPVSTRAFLIGFAILFIGLLLLTGFVFHEVGIVTPLDGMYTWLHTTFGGMEPGHPVGGWMWGG